MSLSTVSRAHLPLPASTSLGVRAASSAPIFLTYFPPVSETSATGDKFGDHH